MNEPDPDTELLLEHLIDAQLLDPVERDSVGGPQYRLHDLVRLFAAERAETEDSPSERQAARSRTLGAWLSLADAAYRAIHGGDHLVIHGDAPRFPVDPPVLAYVTGAPLEWFDTVRTSVVSTIRQAHQTGAAGACWDLAATTSPLFEMTRSFDEWQQLLEVAAASAVNVDDPVGRAAVLHRLGMLLADRQQPRDARDRFRQAGELFAAAGHQRGVAVITAFAAMADRFLNDTAAALAGYERALHGFEKVQDWGGAAFALRGIGQIHLDHDEFDLAEDCLDRALTIYRRIGAQRGAAQTLHWKAVARLKTGRYAEGEALYREVLSVTRGVRDRSGEGVALRGLSSCHRALGDVERARDFLNQALALVQQPRQTILEAAIRRELADLPARPPDSRRT